MTTLAPSNPINPTPQEPQSGTLAELLRDAHVPDLPPAWPPGLWFWLALFVGCVVLLALVLFGVYWFKHYQRYLWRRQALQRFDAIVAIDETHEFLRALRQLLRQVSLTTGQKIDENGWDNLFDDQIFAKNPDLSNFDRSMVIVAARKWIRTQQYV